jgi:hypothetical protein
MESRYPLLVMPTLGENKAVLARILAYAAAIGWTVISRRGQVVRNIEADAVGIGKRRAHRRSHSC